MIRRFELIRHEDVSGVSGTGAVAYGVMFADGWVAMQWVVSAPAISIWPSVPAMLAIHGHDGCTVVRWIDRFSDEPTTVETPEDFRARN